MEVIHGDCRTVLPAFPDASFDCVVTDPPYPCIKRPYGYWTEQEWFDLMDAVVPEVRRVLKPSGSAVFILQPNSERVGRMRTWIWEFMAKWGREWGMVQDAYWWNFAMNPTAGACNGGLMRESVKVCVWLGSHNCYRDQRSVLWDESEANRDKRLAGRFSRISTPSKTRVGTTPIGYDEERFRRAATERGGVTPFNLLPVANSDSRSSAAAYGHGAGTPLPLTRWWARYICPPGGNVLDPFGGSGTTGVAAAMEGRTATLIEQDASHVETIRRRLAATDAKNGLFAGAIA